MRTYVIDTETTGLTSRDEVIQLATIAIPDVATLLTLEVDNVFKLPTSVEYFNPSAPIHPEAQKVHGLSKLKLLKFPKSSTCKLSNEVEQVIGHNVAFDQRMLRTSLPSICTKKLSENLKLVKDGFVKDNKLATLFEYFYPLATFAKLHEVVAPEKHDALADCYKCLLVYINLLRLQNDKNN